MKLTFRGHRIKYTYFYSSGRDKHDGTYRYYSCTYKNEKVIRGEISLKNSFFDFGDLWRLNR